MKDLLVRKPSLAELTGITESRLNCFATQLRAYLAGSVAPSSDSSEFRFPQTSFNCSKSSSRFRQCGTKTLSPRSSSFKEGPPKSLLNIRNAAAREKLRRRGDNHIPSIDLSLQPSNSSNSSTSKSFQKDKNPQVNRTHPFPSFNFLELPLSGPEIQVPFSGSSPFSPHYCWCPIKGNPQLPISSTESFSLPPLSSLLSSTRPSTLLSSNPPPVNFPSFLPDPIIGLPSSQQIPTFTPFICDPIVHIPVIDVYSSGQGYLVSAGPAMSTSISPLKSNFVDPLLPNTESVVEKSARETLRMLISSSNQNKPQLLKVFPSVLSSSVDDKNMLGSSSRGIYSGSSDVDGIIPGSMSSSMGLVFLSGKSKIDLIDQKEKPSSSDSCNFDGGIN